jgi:FhuF-like iron-sulfur protein
LRDTGQFAGADRFAGAGLSFRRRSCCLYYRVPGGGLCGDCTLGGPLGGDCTLGG